jgi:hypothetical protein
MDASATDTFAISLLDALQMVRDSWTEVTVAGIKNCFSKAGFRMNNTAQVSYCTFPEPQKFNFDSAILYYTLKFSLAFSVFRRHLEQMKKISQRQRECETSSTFSANPSPFLLMWRWPISSVQMTICIRLIFHQTIPFSI